MEWYCPSALAQASYNSSLRASEACIENERTTSAKGVRFGMIGYHTASDRKWAYDRESPVGRLDKALDEAGEKGWTVVDMERDWRVVWPTKSVQDD